MFDAIEADEEGAQTLNAARENGWSDEGALREMAVMIRKHILVVSDDKLAKRIVESAR